MRVLVSTEKTQGQKKKDFCFVPEGELLVQPSDGGPYLIGAECFKATTTFAAEERDDLDMGSYAAALLAARRRQWAFAADDPELAAEAQQEAEDTAKVAAAFDAGTVLSIVGNKYVARKAE